MFIQLSIGRNRNDGRVMNYDEWRHFIGNAQTLVKGFAQKVAHSDVTVLDPEVHEGVGQWPGAGREESAHVSWYLPDELTVPVSTIDVNAFIGHAGQLAHQHYQDAINVVVVQQTRGIATLTNEHASA